MELWKYLIKMVRPPGGTGNSAQCYVAAWMGEGFGGEWIHIYVWVSPFTVHLKLSQHC